VTFGIGPATGGHVDGRPGFNFLQPRGGNTKDNLAVVNLTYKPLTLNLYPADAVNASDGSLGVVSRTAKSKDAANWITLQTPTGKFFVVVPPRSTTVVPFTVKVPADAPVGDHLAGLVASIVSAGQAPGDRTTNVKFEQRVAVRAAIRVAGKLNPQLSVTDLTATYVGSLNPFARGSALVTYTVTNTGNVRLGGHQAVTVHGLFGGSASASGLVDVPLLLPGGSAAVTAEVQDVVPGGLMTADVTVVSVAPAVDADPEFGVATGSVRFWAIPWTFLAVLLLLALLSAWFWRQRRERAAAQDRRVASPAPMPEPVGVGGSSQEMS